MNDFDTRDETESDARAHRIKRWLLRQAPYILVLVLTIGGVAYTSFAVASIVNYWLFLAFLTALVCIGTGWPQASDQDARLRLMGTQALHWLAVFVAMRIALLPRVQSTANIDITGLMILMLLALGTFTAGIHIPAWQLAFLGIVMAVSVPAIAWLEDSAIFLVLATIFVGGLSAAVWWFVRNRRQERENS
jgi:Flp pilus assembly protein TadB